jgi:hypothetical protein
MLQRSDRALVPTWAWCAAALVSCLIAVWVRDGLPW